MFINFSPFNEILFSILLGIVQGITEFLPISSTAHLLIVSKYITRSGISLAASNVIQFGTLIAIIQYFIEDIKVLVGHIIYRLKNLKDIKEFFTNFKNWFQEPNQIFDLKAKNDILISQLIIATLPIIATALIFRKTLEALRENLFYVAIFLTVGGILIVYAELMHIKKINSKKSKMMSFRETLMVGLFQSVAVFPGISRSGSALAGGLFLGRNRAESVRFSFLLSLPALGLASTYDLIKVIGEFKNGSISLLPNANGWTTSTLNISILSIGVAFIIAYIVGLITLKFLLKYLATNDSKVFVAYRIILVLFIIATYSISR
jgi:undecaprenyl-diphosphatase